MTAHRFGPAGFRRARRGQLGMTLVETVLAVALSALVVIPVLGWAIVAFDQHAATRDRSLQSAGEGLVRTYLVRDITNSQVAMIQGPSLVDCTGGPGAGTPAIALAEGAERVVYTTAPGSEGGLSLWRRTCDTAEGPVTDTIELATNLVAPGGFSVSCRATTLADGSCPYVTVRVTDLAGVQVSVTAAARTTPGLIDVSPSTWAAAPTVVVTASPVRTERGTTVQFSSAGSADPRGGPLAYSWDFGNGATSTLAAPTTTYQALGSYNAVLKVTTSLGVYATGYVTVDVVSRVPVAVIASPAPNTEVFRGVSVQFSSAGSNDTADAPWGGSIVSYLWEFPDGTTSALANPTKSFGELSPPDTTTMVNLTVTDNDGRTTLTSIPIRIVNRVPTLWVATDRSAGGSPLTVTFTPTVVDETTMSVNPPLDWSWEFGAGAVPATSASGGPKTVTFTGDGVRTVTVTVTDDAGAQATASVTIVVGLPVANFSTSTGSGRAPLSVSFTNQSSAPAGEIDAWEWNFGNGAQSTVQSPAPQTFSVNDPASDTFVSHTYTVTLRVRNNYGVWSTPASRTVTVTGAPAPTNLVGVPFDDNKRTPRRGIDFTWTASPTTNLNQLILCDSVDCAKPIVAEFTGTSGTVGTASKTDYAVRIRARDTNTGKWGAWSSPINVRTL
jgi:PKD repeat protein